MSPDFANCKPICTSSPVKNVPFSKSRYYYHTLATNHIHNITFLSIQTLRGRLINLNIAQANHCVMDNQKFLKSFKEESITFNIKTSLLTLRSRKRRNVVKTVFSKIVRWGAKRKTFTTDGSKVLLKISTIFFLSPRKQNLLSQQMLRVRIETLWENNISATVLTFPRLRRPLL